MKMENFELNFDKGLRPYCVNGEEGVFCINPTDTEFIARLSDAFDGLRALWDSRGDGIENSDDFKSVIDRVEEMDKETRKIIDGLLGEGVSAKVFGAVSTFALSDGFPLWANFLLALMEDCSNAYQRQKALSNPRLEKYLKKYRRGF